jgi:hypothetical protein
MDALLAVALAFLAAGTIALGAQPLAPGVDVGPLEALARDFAVLRTNQVAGADTGTFASLTGFTVSDAPPAGSTNLSVGSTYFLHPFPVETICGCSTVSCNLTKFNATCLNRQENLTESMKRFWVTP